MSTRPLSCYYTYFYVNLSLIIPIIDLHYQQHQHVIMHEVALLDKNKASLTIKWLTRVFITLGLVGQ